MIIKCEEFLNTRLGSVVLPKNFLVWLRGIFLQVVPRATSDRVRNNSPEFVPQHLVQYCHTPNQD